MNVIPDGTDVVVRGERGTVLRSILTGIRLFYVVEFFDGTVGTWDARSVRLAESDAS